MKLVVAFGDLAPWGRNCGAGVVLCGCLGLISAEPRSPVTHIDLYSSVVPGLRPRWLKPHLGVKGVGKASPEMIRVS